MAAYLGKLQAPLGQSKRAKAGVNMKSPEKKKRKSSAQGAAFSHLSEFAPPPTPMVDHLVASNPFEDDFGPPSRGAGPPPGPPPTGGPFLHSPGSAGPGGYGGGGGLRMPGPGVPYGGAGQSLRRPPFPSPGHHQMGPGGFGLPGFGQHGGGNLGGGFPPGPQFNIPQNFSPPGPMHPGAGFNPMLSPGALSGGGGGGGPPSHPRFGQQQQQQGGHPFSSLSGPRPFPNAINNMSNMNNSLNNMNNLNSLQSGPYPSPDGHFTSPSTPGIGGDDSKAFHPHQQPSAPPPPPSNPPQSGPGVFPNHPSHPNHPEPPAPNTSPPGPGSGPIAGPVNGGQPQQAAPNNQPKQQLPPGSFHPNNCAGNGSGGGNGGPLPGGPGQVSAPTPPPQINSSKAPGTGGTGSGLVFPCGFCLSEVHDDQDAILCEASCQKWFHRECTGMTETAYSLLTRESSAVWACDFCLKSKEIQSVYVREGLGQLVAANEG
ncbi:pygopus homolog 2 isoform X1 [Erpetoichthys calabaricus]|uniref:pygopus homolog 2 isoform X1 n=2 Tax=Erpetoichthys calabaricus TaxID=27687 RepID=UPI002233E5CC|nr:pygopus homolog 2 isoform X1 [Erpetoichthys calabaricus]XP_051779241.1 pygopus homolog 2 isoform X1 [Erpetoichthys calabaricus]